MKKRSMNKNSQAEDPQTNEKLQKQLSRMRDYQHHLRGLVP